VCVRVFVCVCVCARARALHMSDPPDSNSRSLAKDTAGAAGPAHLYRGPCFARRKGLGQPHAGPLHQRIHFLPVRTIVPPLGPPTHYELALFRDLQHVVVAFRLFGIAHGAGISHPGLSDLRCVVVSEET